MSENTITLTGDALTFASKTARAHKSETLAYDKYVKANGVTADTVAEHVAAFRDNYRTMFPKADGADVKAYATKVRNGLNRWVEKGESEARATGNYVTREGLKAADMEAFLMQCKAEWVAAQK